MYIYITSVTQEGGIKGSNIIQLSTGYGHVKVLTAAFSMYGLV